MHVYKIYDVWMALKLAFKNFFSLIFIVWLVVFIAIFNQDMAMFSFIDGEIENAINFALALNLLIALQSVIIYFANRRYIIDMNTGLVTFPRSDIENSIIAIILLYPYWNLMRTMTIHASEIENIYLDVQRWSTKRQVRNGTTVKGKAKYKTETKRHVLYTINITGTFGSANLPFLERQKRDEVRNAIQQCVKHVSGKNVDRKVAEFS